MTRCFFRPPLWYLLVQTRSPRFLKPAVVSDQLPRELDKLFSEIGSTAKPLSCYELQRHFEEPRVRFQALGPSGYPATMSLHEHQQFDLPANRVVFHHEPADRAMANRILQLEGGGKYLLRHPLQGHRVYSINL